jgi:hypothetical protein
MNIDEIKKQDYNTSIKRRTHIIKQLKYKRGCKNMKGTAILFQEESITFIEDVERSVFDEIKEQCGCDHCTCNIENKIINFGSVSPVFWCEDDIDWDYGY